MPNTNKLVEIDHVREKLVELFLSVPPVPVFAGKRNGKQHFVAEHYADHLIANGVTFAEGNNVLNKWTPVTEELPKTIPCGAGTEYSEAVNVLTSGRKVLTAIWNGSEFIADAAFWDAEGEEVTHWTPVLLPLPVPPKQEEA